MKSNCDNCGWQGAPAKGLSDIPDLFERLSPGGTVPSGECPKCGALCYPLQEKHFSGDILIPFKLDDVELADNDGRQVLVRINARGIGIAILGYGDKNSMDGHGEPIWVEVAGEKVILRAWADINSEEPTHVIDLEGALESARKEIVS